MSPRAFASALAVTILVALVIGACGDTPTNPGTPDDPVVGDTLLIGDPGTSAITAIGDKAPTAAPEDDVTETFLVRSRLSAVVHPAATVAQVNQALLAHGARISSSVAGNPFVVLSIAPAANEAAVRAVAAALMGTPAFLLATPEFTGQSKAMVLPASGDSGVSHLTPGRYPAAWNVQSLAETRVRALVPDWYDRLTPIPAVTPLRFPTVASMVRTRGNNHGFHVAGILAADHDASPFTGAFPRADRIDVDGLSMGGLGWSERYIAIRNAFPPTGNFVLSTSMGYKTGPQNDAEAFKYARDALQWRLLVWRELDRFLHLTAASNEGNLPGLPGQALSSSAFNLARFQPDLKTYVDGLSVPAEDKAAFTVLWNWAATNAPLVVEASPNLVSVGSSNRIGTESLFDDWGSSRGSDIRAVGEEVFGPCVVADRDLATDPDRCNGTRARYSGTSMATPTAAGLAAYLWSLDPTLTPVAIRAILQKAFDFAWTQGVLDAYLAVQLLDGGLADARVRRALLDVATADAPQGADGRFDQYDIEAFLQAFSIHESARRTAGRPDSTDHSRHDLNGDGLTGDTLRFAPFDLDADGILGGATRVIEGFERTFDEARVTDLDILCFYAYSPLYQGGTAARRDLLPNCARDDGPDPEPIPASVYYMDGADFVITLQGQNSCSESRDEVGGALPVQWEMGATCNFTEGSVTALIRTEDDARWRGSASVSYSGRFQATTDSMSYAAANTDFSTYHSFRVDGGPVGTGHTIHARIRIRLEGTLPALPQTGCPNRGSVGLAEIDFYVQTRIFNTSRRETAFAGCWGNFPTFQVEEVIEVPIFFQYGVPTYIYFDAAPRLQVGGPHSLAVTSTASVTYELIEFVGLPEGAVVLTERGANLNRPPTDP